jgi:nucleoside-diphosphate kinase
MEDKTLILIKPDAVEEKLTGVILDRIEKRGFRILRMEMLSATAGQIHEHYEHLLASEHFPRILAWMTRSPLVALILERENAIAEARAMIGTTDPQKAAIGTIRGDFAKEIGANRIHASEDENAFWRESAIWFGWAVPTNA